MPEAEDLSKKRCKPCEGKTQPLNRVMVEGYLASLPGWAYKDPSSGPSGPSGRDPSTTSPSAQGSGGQAGRDPSTSSGRGGWIEKTYNFQNFHETMSFVNAVAFIANHEDHHPDLEVGYKACKVKYITHAIKGLSENDFICAAKVEALLK